MNPSRTEGSTKGYPIYSVEVLSHGRDSILQAGNPVKEILLKLNLPDHRLILTDSKIQIKMVMERLPGFQHFHYSDIVCLSSSDEALKSKNFKEVSVTLIIERFSRSDEVLKLKNFKKDASLKLSSYQIKKGMSMSVQKSRVHKMAKFTRWRKEILAWEEARQRSTITQKRTQDQDKKLQRLMIKGEIVKGKVPTEMELVLEQTQQGTSYEVSVDPHKFEDSHKDGHGDDDVLKSKNFKEVSVTLIIECFSRSDEVLKLKNFKKDASLKLSSYQIKKGAQDRIFTYKSRCLIKNLDKEFQSKVREESKVRWIDKVVRSRDRIIEYMCVYVKFKWVVRKKVNRRYVVENVLM
ncbi:hypothetical protein Tco_0672757 [Tanacetum coccineum]